MDIEQFKKTMQDGSIKEKIELLSQIADKFESYVPQNNEDDTIVEILIDEAIGSIEAELIDEILETICKAEIYQDTSTVNFDRLAQNIDSISERFLPRYIDVLSYTHNKTYLSLITRFKNHDNKLVRQAVEYALIELGE